MIILKYMFLFFVFLGAWFIGNLVSRKYKYRVKELKDFKEFFNILESKIKFTYEPLGEIFLDTKQLVKNNNINKILENTNINLKNNNFKIAWENAITSSATELCLNDEDLGIIKGLGNMLRTN